MENPETRAVGQTDEVPSLLMEGIHQLRTSALELRSKLNVVLERHPSSDVKVEAQSLDEKALDVIADTQDILGDILLRLIA